MVERGRLTPALVAPVSGVVEHVEKKPELLRHGPTKAGPVYMLVQVAPPSVERYMMFPRLVPQPELQPLPLFSSMPAM